MTRLYIADALAGAFKDSNANPGQPGLVVLDSNGDDISGGGGGGGTTIADGADVTQGAIADAAVITDAAGTVSAKLRGTVKLLADILTDLSNGDQKTQLTDGTNNVSVSDLTTAKALDVAVFDATGVQVSAFTNTEYQDGDTDATPNGALGMFRDGNTLRGASNVYPLPAQSPRFALLLDDYTTASVTYVCEAPIGTATSSAAWRIKKIDETTGMVIKWADGNESFDNVADNRASLTYS